MSTPTWPLPVDTNGWYNAFTYGTDSTANEAMIENSTTSSGRVVGRWRIGSDPTWSFFTVPAGSTLKIDAHGRGFQQVDLQAVSGTANTFLSILQN